ncbi:hypothetical protein [Halomonas sp. SL1]|uniref:hypothetical protein n=1 Tax=Halomonas sp. SL1 TaxID=2137478 RepID=UPI0011B9366F|nr:hypothetical protein [Halomonas sp. SL1]
MSPRMRDWLKRGEEFYLFALVTTAAFMISFNFDIEQPYKMSGFFLQLLGATLSIIVVIQSYIRHSDSSPARQAIDYFKDFPLFRRKKKRFIPAGTILTLRPHVVDTSKLEFKEVDITDWQAVNHQLKALTNAINSDRTYLKALDERTSAVGEKVLKDLLPQFGSHQKEQQEEQVSSSRLMLVAFGWIIIGMLTESVPLASNPI